jgi:hypothetical protein
MFFKQDKLRSGSVDKLRRFRQKITEELVHYSIRAVADMPGDYREDR